ncbi:MAG: hypothetical protein IJK43_11840 [Prevotella sp.]|nr:hypothetical protein [Prevotella sp.]
MKRIIIMLLIACSAITTASADPTATPQKKAKSVIRSLEGIIAFYAEKGIQTLSITKNPETGLIESSERIAPFTCQKEDLWTIPIGFSEDEPLSYQYMHLLPGNTELFNLKVVTNNGQKSKDVRIRTNSKQEMWFMCCKNPDNPQLRDAYAIVWEETKDKNVAGTVYMITSLRPDLYTKNLETSKNTFRIDGRVGYDLTDSLYVVYMADTSEELDKQADDAFIAYMPVKNKRFSFSVEIDKPKVGRIRTVMPDGSLCHLWTNLDFVPGETYQITTHNGYYDEDRDYERRVGRYSGKSLLNQRQIIGNDDVVADELVNDDVVADELVNDNVVADELAIDTIPGYNESFSQSSNWEPTPEQKMQIEAKVMTMIANMDAIKASYASLEPHFKMKSLTGSDRIFAQITKLNKELDVKFQDFIKYLNGLDVPPTEKAEFGEIYKKILKFYTEQNQGFTEMYKEVGVLTKAAQKTQKYINGLTEKYLKEMTKAVIK